MRLGGGLGAALLVVGLDRRRARLETEAVRLADHGIAGHAAHFPRDLACAQTVRPKLFKHFNAFFSPGHEFVPCFVQINHI